jgi:hypothetical protein
MIFNEFREGTRRDKSSENILTLEKQQSIVQTAKPLVHVIFLFHRLITMGGEAMGSTKSLIL